MMAVLLKDVRKPLRLCNCPTSLSTQVIAFLGVVLLLVLMTGRSAAQSDGSHAQGAIVADNSQTTNASTALPEAPDKVISDTAQSNTTSIASVAVPSLPQPHEPFLYARPVIRRSDITNEGNEREKRLMEWIMDRAEEGSLSAQYELGIRYLTGRGVVKNEDLGRGWLQKAAKLGDMDAYEKFKNTDFEKEIVDKDGRVVQSTDARRRFMEQSGYPQGRIGYVICHIVPVYNGGLDAVENMTWRPINEAFAQEPWNLRGWVNNTD